ncbi:hypothetical protein BDW22DRAFT_1406051 [Trametopsis cervina]|nr:hypothetical protein BDW22DRAFT_1406051 [Trametopsis cervina]
MATEYQLGIIPVKVNELPPEEVLISQGRALIDGSASWHKGKTFYKTVQTSSRSKFKGEPANWHARVSEHGPEEATFDELWNKLGVNKGENEVNYVKEVKKATLVKQISPTQAIWSMYYKFPPPVSPRVFTVLQTIQFNEASPREGLIVSIPVDLSPDAELAKKEEKGVKARYVSIEQLKELENGKTEWRMATSSRAEGLIPQFLTESSMPSSISHDVPGLLNWLKTLRAPEQGKEQAAAAPPASSEEPSTASTAPGAAATEAAPVEASPAAGK